jgi:hypothetical protein
MNVVLFFLYSYCRAYHIQYYIYDVCATCRLNDVCILCRLCTKLMVFEAMVIFILTPMKEVNGLLHKLQKPRMDLRATLTIDL